MLAKKYKKVKQKNKEPTPLLMSVPCGSLDYLFTELGSIYAEVKIGMDKMRANCEFIRLPSQQFAK
ncbi:MAG: hypothetical protein WC813_02405 [Patescibacteria group bacterium]|jgi:hypothetical protein